MTKKSVFNLLGTTLFAAACAQAGVILTVNSGSVGLGDPTQTGRLSRNAIPQDWSGTETFPGVINTGVTYHYHTYSINVGITPFVQITFDSLSPNTFISAYDTSYLPDSAGTPNFGFNTNWLGDAGGSGNFFGTDPLFFQVLVPINDTLVIVVNNTGGANVGVGDAFNQILVEGFIDSEFDDPPSVPEPSAMVLSGAGLLLLPLLARLRVRRNRKA